MFSDSFEFYDKLVKMNEIPSPCFPLLRHPTLIYIKTLDNPAETGYSLSLFLITMSYNPCCSLSICKIRDFCQPILGNW